MRYKRLNMKRKGKTGQGGQIVDHNATVLRNQVEPKLNPSHCLQYVHISPTHSDSSSHNHD